jgi:hypothetical protein
MDSSCSRYMTEDAKWFSNLTTIQNKEYVTFRDGKKGKVKTNGIIKVNEHSIFKDVALVKYLKYKLLYISLVLDEGLEISFRHNAFRVFDSCGNLISGFSQCLTH